MLRKMLAAVCLALALGVIARAAGAQGATGIDAYLYQGPGESASEREVYVWDLVQGAGWRHDANPYVLMTVIRAEAGRDLVFDARGDHGTSRGLAQLNTRSTGLIHHFWAIGYTDSDDPAQAVEYMARCFGGEFAAQGIGPWRWTAWRRLGRPWVP